MTAEIADVRLARANDLARNHVVPTRYPPLKIPED